jgi:hypothetical protein
MRAGLRGSAAPNLSKAAPNIRRCFCVKASDFAQLYLFDLSIWGRRMISGVKAGDIMSNSAIPEQEGAAKVSGAGSGAGSGASSATSSGANVEPLAQSGARIGSLDFIRGIAVMGILAANIIVFGQPWNAYTYPAAFLSEHGPVSDWLLVVQFVLIDGKMRGLFTLLFGAGVYLFMEKAWAKGRGRKLQALRLFWLLIFGLIHYFLIWPGDIPITHWLVFCSCFALIGSLLRSSK